MSASIGKVLTKEQIDALFAIRGGADIYSYGEAKLLREIEKIDPTLLHIGKPQMYTGDGTDQVPYFGAIITQHGKAYIRKVLK